MRGFIIYIHTQEQVAVQICGFDGFQRSNYLGGEPIRSTEVEVRIGKLKNGKVTCKDEITEEMIKGGGDRVVDWIWRLCNMPFESSVVPEDWKSTVIVLLYKGKGESTECRSYRSTSLFSEILKLYAAV